MRCVVQGRSGVSSDQASPIRRFRSGVSAQDVGHEQAKLQHGTCQRPPPSRDVFVARPSHLVVVAELAGCDRAHATPAAATAAALPAPVSRGQWWGDIAPENRSGCEGPRVIQVAVENDFAARAERGLGALQEGPGGGAVHCVWPRVVAGAVVPGGLGLEPSVWGGFARECMCAVRRPFVHCPGTSFVELCMQASLSLRDARACTRFQDFGLSKVNTCRSTGRDLLSSRERASSSSSVIRRHRHLAKEKRRPLGKRGL